MQNIVQTWKQVIENSLFSGKMEIYIDDDCFLLRNDNPQCIIDVWQNNIYIGNYTHIESFMFDLQNVYCPKHTFCDVKVNRKRKRA